MHCGCSACYVLFALGTATAHSGRGQEFQTLWLDLFPTLGADTIRASVEAGKGFLYSLFLLLGALLQGQVKFPLVDRGVPNAQAVVPFGFKTPVKPFDLALNCFQFFLKMRPGLLCQRVHGHALLALICVPIEDALLDEAQ